MTLLRLFATCARSTETVLRDELRALRFHHVRADRGGVNFEGDLGDALRACLHSRVAVRILVHVGEGPAETGDALYETVRSVDWSPHITPAMTIAVSAVTRDSALTHTHFIAQRTKDAIVDLQRERGGARSSVDLDDADARIFVHVVRDRAALFLDASGESLHRRGYRTQIGMAPLKETLAATMIHLSGWDGTTPFIDPMCGSGTIAIEAALGARFIAPGIFRARFGVERWASHDAAARRVAAELRAAARARAVREAPPIVARDLDARVLDVAKANAERAGVLDSIRWKYGRIGDLDRDDGPGWLVTNPPYDERMRADDHLYAEISTGLYRLSGHHAVLLSGSPALERAIRQKPAFRTPLWNGAIECKLVGYAPR